MLQVRLLGQCDVTGDGIPTTIPSRRVQSLPVDPVFRPSPLTRAAAAFDSATLSPHGLAIPALFWSACTGWMIRFARAPGNSCQLELEKG